MHCFVMVCLMFFLMMSDLQIPYIPGITLLKIFKEIKVKECLFDDFMRYEVEEARVKQYRRRKLSHNAPDFVPVSQRREDASDAQQAKVSSVLIDRTLEIQNVAEKLHDGNMMKHQDPCVELVEKQASEAEKENGQRENLSNGKHQQDTAKTNLIPGSSLRTGVDGKQQYWKKVENPRPLADNTAQGPYRAPEKRLNGICNPASVVSEKSKEQKIVTKVASLKISSKAGEADCNSCPVGVVTIGSMPVRVSEV
jgi:YTH domain-containing family protein